MLKLSKKLPSSLLVFVLKALQDTDSFLSSFQINCITGKLAFRVSSTIFRKEKLKIKQGFLCSLVPCALNIYY